MKKGLRTGYLIITAMAVVISAMLALNIVIMHNMAMEQTEEIGRMRIEIIASDLQKQLDDAVNSVERVSGKLESVVETNGDEEHIRRFLSDEKKNEIASSGRSCLNIFCIINNKSEVLISDMETPADYVVQDRIWYKGLMAAEKGETYISTIYPDAFTDSMCFTVSKILNDGNTIIGIDYSMSEIQTYIEKMSGSGYGDAMIVNREGTIVGAMDSSLVGEKISSQLENYKNAFTQATETDESSISAKLQDGIVFCSRTKNDWYLMLGVGDWELHKADYKQFIYNSVMLILMTIVIILMYFIDRRERLHAERILRDKERVLSGLSEDLQIPLRRLSEYGSNAIHTNNESIKPVAEGILHEVTILNSKIENLLSYSNAAPDNGKNEEKTKPPTHLTISTQHRFRLWIVVALLAAMAATMFISSNLYIRLSRTNMSEEANNYKHQISSWVLEQKSIMDMFVNSISANPGILDNYDAMVAYLDDITKHYPGISATYIANPNFSHGHPMVMNNGWVPADEYVEEERQWYIGAMETDDYSITEPYYDARTGKYCITFSKAVYDDKDDFLGVFAVDFYLDVLTGILDSSYKSDSYAFLADKDGQIIDHPNPEYQVYNDTFVNIKNLVYNSVYTGGTGEMKAIKDYDGKYRMCLLITDDTSKFNIIVLKDIWSMYGNVLTYTLFYLVLFSICIIGVVMLINRMIRWQKEANENLKEAADAATAADKAKSRFLAQMSHEIRTPINAVLGMNEMILRENDSPEIDEYALNIQSAGNTLLSLINEILDFSKIEDGKMHITPVSYKTSTLINDLVTMVADRARRKNLKFELDIDPDLPKEMYGDDIRLRQIIVNLLSNAVKYTENGSVTLSIKLKERVEADKVILRVEVRDTGIGIRKDDMTKLFDSFQRLDEKRNRGIEGTGLGIPITHNLLRMMGSNLEVQSEYGKGSMFGFDLSQTVLSDETIGELDIHHHENHREERYIYAPSARVLVVDDNAMNLKVAAGLLKRNGIVPDTAESGKECIALAKKNHYDIIFMDHMMPDMDGFEALRRLKENKIVGEDTAVIAMTANAVTGAAKEYVEAGFRDYLSKPIVVSALEGQLEQYLPNEIVSYKTDKIEYKKAEPKQNEEQRTQAKKPEIAERFPFLDVQTGMMYCGSDEEFYEKMLSVYANDSKLDEIATCFKNKDWKNYRILVHALKSTSMSIGAADLSEQAKDLEMAAKEGNIEYILSHHASCMAEYGSLLKKLSSALDPNTAEEEYTEADEAEHILVVDDDVMNLKMARQFLVNKYTVSEAQSGDEAMEILKKEIPDLILLDVHMPGKDGFDVIAELKNNAELKNIPVVFLTADDNRDTEVRGFKAGAIDFIRKPFIADIMLQRVQRILELSRLQKNLRREVKKQTQKAEERREKVERLSRQTVLSLAKAVDAKDKYTNGHSERVAKYATEIAKRAGFSAEEQKDIYFMGLLHDIGKIGVPDAIINKPSRLTDEEFAEIKKHPEIGAEILKNITEIPEIEQGARSHHERYGGGGYPNGISGENIPVFARIIGVADAYDAMTSKRSYRGVMSQSAVREEIVNGKGTQFDPKFADIMLAMIDEDVNYEMHEQ